jgi:hypothetical protein
MSSMPSLGESASNWENGAGAEFAAGTRTGLPAAGAFLAPYLKP